MSESRCAFLTLEDRTGFYIYDDLTFEPLRQLNWNVVEIPWSKCNVDWNEFQVVVIRSTWDYHHNTESFLQVLEKIERSSAKLYNSSNICRWNLDKRYLRDLEHSGVPVIPTLWPDPIDKSFIYDAFATLNTNRLVVKPRIGANADDTFVLWQNMAEAWNEALDVFSRKPAMVQPFVESVVSVGEYSLIYFSKEFSHAIKKTPAPHDFRVQEEHGGTVSLVYPTSDQLEVADQVMAAIDENLLYARIDIIELENKSPAVIEVELIEPSLYFNYDEHSPFRFAEQLNRRFR